jgi:hypothetical protein
MASRKKSAAKGKRGTVKDLRARKNPKGGTSVEAVGGGTRAIVPCIKAIVPCVRSAPTTRG